MPIPFVDITRYEPGFLDRWSRRVRAISDIGRFFDEEIVETLEQKLCAATGARCVVACASGTDALQLALRAHGIGPGDEVWIPELTFWATCEAAINIGAKVITFDCDIADLQLDVDRVERRLRRHRPAAIITAHLYGWASAELPKLRRLCREAEIALIEDGAQCFGVSIGETDIFAGADTATTSFYPTKVLGTSGNGGAVLCRDPALAERVRCLRNHGRNGAYRHDAVGWNSRLCALQAAFLLLALDSIDTRLAARRRVAAQYRRAFEKAGIAVAGPSRELSENGYLNVLLLSVTTRQAVQNALEAADIGFGRIYPVPISQQSGVGFYLNGRDGGENAARICASVLNLPLFTGITAAEVEEIIGVVLEAAGP